MAISRRDVKLTYSHSGELNTKNLTYIDPALSTAEDYGSLKSALQGILSLTTDSYVDANVIDTQSLNSLVE